MRSRNIKPGFFKNEVLAGCHPLARILFQGLWCMSDRKGHMEYRPKRIKAEILPYDKCDVEKLLKQLHDRGFILIYEVENQKYIEISTFLKHQHPHIKEPESTIPAPDQHQTSPVQEPEKHQSSPADSLLLIPDSLLRKADSRIPQTDSIKKKEQAENPVEEINSKTSLIVDKLQEVLKPITSKTYQNEIALFVKRNSHTKNPDAIIHCLNSFQKCKEKIINPRRYLEKVLADENGNYNEREAIQEHEEHKKPIPINGIPGLGEVLKSMAG